MRTYQIVTLDSPIPNPKPDGRKRNWTGEKQFLPGRYAIGGNMVRKIGAGRWDRVDVYSNKEGFKAIEAACSEVKPHGVRELLLTIDREDSADTLLGVLIHQGTITKEQVIEAAAKLEADESLYDFV